MEGETIFKKGFFYWKWGLLIKGKPFYSRGKFLTQAAAKRDEQSWIAQFLTIEDVLSAKNKVVDMQTYKEDKERGL